MASVVIEIVAILRRGMDWFKSYPTFPYPFFLPLQEFVAGDRSEELILKLDNRHLLGSSDHTKVYRAVHHSLAEYIQALA